MNIIGDYRNMIVKIIFINDIENLILIWDSIKLVNSIQMIFWFIFYGGWCVFQCVSLENGIDIMMIGMMIDVILDVTGILSKLVALKSGGNVGCIINAWRVFNIPNNKSE